MKSICSSNVENLLAHASSSAVLPINKQLLAYADKQTAAETDLTVAQESDIDTLLDQWRQLNIMRMTPSNVKSNECVSGKPE